MTIESSNSSTISSSSSSSVASQPAENLSATNTPEYIALLQKYTETQKPKTPAQIRASAEVTRAEAEAKRMDGEVRNKLVVLIIVGVITFLLSGFGCYIFVAKPEIAKDVWVVIGPIITAGISGTIGFLSGEKQGNNNSN